MIEIIDRKGCFDFSAESQRRLVNLVRVTSRTLRLGLLSGRGRLMRVTLITFRMVGHRVADSARNGLVTGAAFGEFRIVGHLSGIHMILVREPTQSIGPATHTEFALHSCKLYESNRRAGVFVAANAPSLPFRSADPRWQKFILMTFDAGIMRWKTRRVIF